MTTPTTTARNETVKHLQEFVKLSAEDMTSHLVGTHGQDAVTLPKTKVGLVKEHARLHDGDNPPTAPKASTPDVSTPASRKAPATKTPAAKSTKTPAARAESKPAAKDDAKPAKPATQGPRDFLRTVDALIIQAAGEIVAKQVPAKFRADVLQLVSNQMHHMASPSQGWPTGKLPKPKRSEWR